MRQPELLAPAGSWGAVRAAVANGADAVYFGVEAFNARLRAENIQRDELPALMNWLHRRGVKGFLTLNVLVFSDELEQAAQLLLAARSAAVDALIVQDVGLCRLAAELVPDLPLHASTQMTITSAAGVAQAAELGCERVVLARELSLKDLHRLQRQLRERQLAMPLEVFVHGALCVAYSGQCLTSEALGQRSANRGECAQACRLPYQLVVDGVERDLGEQRYLLSPQDLSAWELLPQLLETGVASLKIEGRLKDPSYVAQVTDTYRRALDGAEAASGVGGGPERDPGATRANLELSFSRGLGTGWLEGVDHRQLVHGRWSKKRGRFLGRLRRQEPRGWLVLETSATLEPGDGLVFEVAGSQPLEAPVEIGGRVMAVESRERGCVAVRLGPAAINTSHLGHGAPCWQSSSPRQGRQAERLARAATPELQQGLKLKLSGALGAPLRLEAWIGSSGEGTSARDPAPLAEVLSPQVLQAATGPGLDRQRLETQLGRLGGTPWRLERLELALPDGLFLPLAQLNALRRALVQQLAGMDVATALVFASSSDTTTTSGEASDGLISTALQRLQQAPLQPVSIASGRALDSGREPVAPCLSVLVRSLEQLEALLEQPLDAVIADLEQPDQLRQAVALGRGRWPGGLLLAGPRICRPDERWSLEPLLRAEADGYLVRNADQLELLSCRAPCVGDFSLNVANPLSARWLLERWGLVRITASYDLDLPQLLELARVLPSERLELTLHQHMPMFHMEHCLFCAFLSDGHDHTDCGRPCEQHQVLLRDRSGAEHPLKADLGCRNTLFNGKAQTAVEALPPLVGAGIRHFRVELLQEDGSESLRRIELYQAALAGRISGRQVWQQEQLISRLGVTRGTLAHHR
ncbi:U32 family peptidase [Cyanobium sp. Morenito 9A2]|nr:U32 family peptidase [Cyanobium sp. Morenito 9A2]